MTMKRLVLLIGVLVVCAGAGLLSSGVQLDYFRAKQQNNDIVVEWLTISEENVHHFELLRSSGNNGQFVDLKVQIRPHGTGRPYYFRDSGVYKTMDEQVRYQLVVVSHERVRTQLSGEAMVGYAPTAVRRTWGSIKAMFQ